MKSETSSHETKQTNRAEKGAALRVRRLGLAVGFWGLATLGTGYGHELTMTDGTTVQAVSYRQGNDRIRFRLTPKGKIYVVDQDRVSHIDGRRLEQDLHEPEARTRIHFTNGKTVEVETCWEEDGEIRFTKAGVLKTYGVKKELVARIAGQIDGDGGGSRPATAFSQKKNDAPGNQASPAPDAYDAFYRKRGQLIEQIKACRNNVREYRTLIGQYNERVRELKRTPVSVIRRKHAWRRKIPWTTSDGVAGLADSMGRPACTPQQYKSYCIRGLKQEKKKAEKNLAAAQKRLAFYDKVLNEIRLK